MIYALNKPTISSESKLFMHDKRSIDNAKNLFIIICIYIHTCIYYNVELR